MITLDDSEIDEIIQFTSNKYSIDFRKSPILFA